MKLRLKMAAVLLLVLVTCQVYAGNTPRLVADTTELDFGVVPIDVETNITFLISNVTNDSVIVSGVYITKNPSVYLHNKCPTILIPNDSCVVNIRFRPVSNRSYPHSLIVEYQKYTTTENEDPEPDSISVRLRGKGENPNQ